MNGDSTNDGIDRRRFLKTSGATAVTGLGFTSMARARGPSSREVVEQSLRLKEATNDIDKWKEYLRNQGFSVASDSHTYEIPKSTDGVSTQEVNTDELHIDISLSYDCEDVYYADLSWQYVDDTDDWHTPIGDVPYDGAGIGFDSDWWDLHSYTISDTTETSQYVSYRDGTADGTGPAFNVDDDQKYHDDNWDSVEYCGLYLDPIGDYSYDERRLQGGYGHTWENISVESISVGFPWAISVTVTDETYRWETDTEEDEDTLLRLAQSDAYDNCTLN